jgi:hypothetical protein
MLLEYRIWGYFGIKRTIDIEWIQSILYIYSEFYGVQIMIKEFIGINSQFQNNGIRTTTRNIGFNKTSFY